ncbi:MAG TPA: anhydro-N-acetylmuramic acid kinase [Chroococcales cyanobacterium]
MTVRALFQSGIYEIVSKQQPLNVIGLNSGTSMDGIDAALFTISPNGTSSSQHLSVKPHLIESRLEPFPPQFEQRLKKLIASQHGSLEEICLLNTALGELFATAAKNLIEQSKGKVDRIDLIGSHGQTIWHAPRQRSFWGIGTTGTLQLGEPSVIAARTGVPVIADFRPADMANGGEGAPLVAFADQALFGADGIATGVLNLGGIANITVLDRAGEAVFAFDTGPANMVIDRICSVLAGCEFDRGGEIAASGKVDQALLAGWLEHPYFRQPPPKTTGREDFGVAYADRLIVAANERGLPVADLVATATALTAQTIATAYLQFVQPTIAIERLVLGGGGAANRTLVDMLRKALPGTIKMCDHDDFGVPAKFKEAFLFALLAYTSYYGIANNVPLCSGARKKVCLGKLVKP